MNSRIDRQFWAWDNNTMSDEPVVPEGLEFLKILSQSEDRCEATTDEALPQMGTQAPLCVERLGTVLSLLDRLSSCWWGCQGGDHAIERLIFRAVSLARASYRLLRFGFYDESIALSRSIGEIANLMGLFSLDRDDLTLWRSADAKAQKDVFSPVKVRLRIEGHGKQAPIDEDRYRSLSSLSLHVTAPIAPQAHNLFERPVSAGHFQQEGFLLSLNELALAMVYVAIFSSTVIPLENELRRTILYAGRDLGDAIGGIDILHIGDYRAKLREQVDSALEGREAPMEDEPKSDINKA
jgi:hypothetical protein